MHAWARNIKADRVAGIGSNDRFTQSTIGSIANAVVMIVSRVNSEGGGFGGRLNFVSDAGGQNTPQPKTGSERESSPNRGHYSGAVFEHAYFFQVFRVPTSLGLFGSQRNARLKSVL